MLHGDLRIQFSEGSIGEANLDKSDMPIRPKPVTAD